MRKEMRTKVQLAIAVFIAVNCFLYYLYVNGASGGRPLSIADLNPYGGWSHLKAGLTDVSYRWKGITRGMALTIAITIAAVITGRIFCSYVCPIGFLQDLAFDLGKRIGIKELRAPKTGLMFEKLKYLVFLLVIVIGTLGYGYIISPLSPWLGYLNLFAGLRFHPGILVLAVLLTAGLAVRRPFCRFLCPLGAYQALLSAVGIARIKDSGNCLSCRHCLKDCPVGISDTSGGTVSPECVSCLKCVQTKCIRDTSGYSAELLGKTVGAGKISLTGLSIITALYLLLPIAGASGVSGALMPVGELKDGNYIGVGTGFGGPIMAEIQILDGALYKITVSSHRETSGYYEEAFRYLGIEIVAAQNLNVDAISGATATTRGYIGAVRSGVSQAVGKE